LYAKETPMKKLKGGKKFGGKFGGAKKMGGKC
jgi:hypothetical protein